MGELANRRAQTTARILEITSQLHEAERLAAGKACVYMTGSFGRCEASQYSDLDLFILGRNDGEADPESDVKRGSQLSRLDEICIMAELIKVTRLLRIPEFSGDGKWLVHYATDDLIKTLGTQKDDVENTFTARLLLLLESRALIELSVHRELVREVVKAYWKDYDDHRSNFMPAFLGNDILRLWRTLCVNYEATTRTMTEPEKVKRKLKNYKLKHSRLLTCYSAILFLLATYNNKRTVHPDDALSMIGLTPTERLEFLSSEPDLANARPALITLLAQYEKFLEMTNSPEGELIQKFMDKDIAARFLEEANKFGDLVFDAFTRIGQGSHFHRLLVI